MPIGACTATVIIVIASVIHILVLLSLILGGGDCCRVLLHYPGAVHTSDHGFLFPSISLSLLNL